MLSHHREKTAASLSIAASWQMQQSAKAARCPCQQQQLFATKTVLVKRLSIVIVTILTIKTTHSSGERDKKISILTVEKINTYNN